MARCSKCDGDGILPDYGPFGMDFYGPKECSACNGTGLKLNKRTLTVSEGASNPSSGEFTKQRKNNVR